MDRCSIQNGPSLYQPNLSPSIASHSIPPFQVQQTTTLTRPIKHPITPIPLNLNLSNSTSSPVASPQASLSDDSTPPLCYGNINKLVYGSPCHLLLHAYSTTSIDSPDFEPSTYTHASKIAQWQSAMQEEFSALQKNNTWTLGPPSPTMNVVGYRWVYRIKRKTDGTIDQYKARLIVKGFNQ